MVKVSGTALLPTMLGFKSFIILNYFWGSKVLGPPPTPSFTMPARYVQRGIIFIVRGFNPLCKGCPGLQRSSMRCSPMCSFRYDNRCRNSTNTITKLVIVIVLFMHCQCRRFYFLVFILNVVECENCQPSKPP